MKIKSILALLFYISLPALAIEQISLQLKWYHQFQFAGYYVAKEMGFYKDVGLDVDIKEYQQGMNIIDDVKNRKSDFGVSSSYIFNDKNKDQLITLAAVFQKSTSILLTKKSSGIDTPEKLKGKSITLQPDDIRSAAVVSMLASVGLGSNDVVYKENSFDVSKFLNNEVDALFAYRTNEPFLLKERNISYNILDPSDYGFDFYSDILFTSSSFLKENPQTVENFYKATMKGWEYAFKHIEKSVALIKAKYNTQNKSTEHLLFEANELKKLAYVKNRNFGQIDPDTIKNIVDIYKVLCFTDKSFCTDGFIYNLNFINHDKTIKLTKHEIEYLQNKKSIRVCVENNEMPYEAIIKGKYIGVLADYMKYFETKIGIPFELLSVPKGKKTSEYCDIQPKKEHIFQKKNNAFLENNFVIVTNTEKVFIDDFKKVQYETFVVVSPTIKHKLQLKYPHTKLIKAQNISQALTMVQSGKAFGFIDTKLNSAYAIQQNYIGLLKISGTLDTDLSISYSIDVLDTNATQLSTIITKAILTLTPQEEKRIQNKWVAIKYEQPFNYQLFWGIVTLISTAILFLLYRNFLMKQQQKKLEALNNSLDRRVKLEVEISRKKDKILFQQAKNASMGEMINHISHQWRQPLSIINGLVISLEIYFKKNILDQKHLSSTLNQIESQTNYMSQTIENFRNYFRPDKNLETFDISDLLNNVLQLTKPILDEHSIEIEINNIDNSAVKGFWGEYVQVVIVILMNAKDALITQKINNPKITLTIVNKMLMIEDNAGGIKENVLQHIFEPFFTTKSKHEGTGVGLHMAKLLIENSMDGTLSVVNGKEGAIFTIAL